MPVEFTRLYIANMESVGVHFKSLAAKAVNNKSFYHLAKMTFPMEYNGDFDFAVVLKKLGWHGVRDQMTAQYLSYAQSGQFKKDYDIRLIHELTDLEETFSNYRMQGFSRVYLLGFYFKLWQITGEDPLYANEVFAKLKDKKFTSLLQISSSRTEFLDILLILMLHFQEFLGLPKLSSHIANGKAFREIFAELKDPQKKQLTQNLSYYTMSIGDENFLFKPLP